MDCNAKAELNKMYFHSISKASGIAAQPFYCSKIKGHRIIRCTPWLHTELPRIQTLRLRGVSKLSLNSSSLRLWAVPWGAYSMPEHLAIACKVYRKTQNQSRNHCAHLSSKLDILKKWSFRDCGNKNIRNTWQKRKIKFVEKWANAKDHKCGEFGYSALIFFILLMLSINDIERSKYLFRMYSSQHHALQAQ